MFVSGRLVKLFRTAGNQRLGTYHSLVFYKMCDCVFDLLEYDIIAATGWQQDDTL
jgi:hypothetical protein